MESDYKRSLKRKASIMRWDEIIGDHLIDGKCHDYGLIADNN